MGLSGLFRSYPVSRPLLAGVHDLLAVVVALPIAVLLRDGGLGDVDRLFGLVSALPALLCAALTATLVFRSYRGVWRYIGPREIVHLAQFGMTAVLVFCIVQFWVDRLVDLPRSVPLIQFLVMMAILLGSRIGYAEYRRWREGPSAASQLRKPLLVVGAGDGAALFISMLATRRAHDYEVVGVVSDTYSRHRSVFGVPVLGGLGEIEAVLATLRVQGVTPARVVVTCPHHELGRDAVYRVMDVAHEHGIAVEQLPELIRFRDDAELPVYGAPSEDPLDVDVYPRVKRILDVVVSGSLLITLMPLLLAVAAAVAIGVKSEVLFVQVRPGRGRLPFKLLKFRTMIDPIDPGGRFLTDGERTPLVGRLLRRTRMDELPQLWNVLVGDMTLIGPRPLMPYDLDAMADGGRARSRVRPGITGWAQVNGGHELSADEKLALDLWYADRANLWLDGLIVWRTVWMVIFGERRNPTAIDAARGFVSARTVAAE